VVDEEGRLGKVVRGDEGEVERGRGRSWNGVAVGGRGGRDWRGGGSSVRSEQKRERVSKGMRELRSGGGGRLREEKGKRWKEERRKRNHNRK